MFIADTCYPDGSVIIYGQPFTKTWIIENSGTKKWQQIQLIHQEGFLPTQSEIDVPDLAPGEQVTIATLVVF